MRWLNRHAWWALVVVSVVLVVFGLTDIATGAAADPAIAQALTGKTLAELEAAGPDAYRLFDFFTRVNGWSLVLAGLLFTVVLLVPFRRGQRWAWWAMWLLPIWALGGALFYVAVGIRADQPPPPPVVSGPILAVLTGAVLLVSGRSRDARPQ